MPTSVVTARTVFDHSPDHHDAVLIWLPECRADAPLAIEVQQGSDKIWMSIAHARAVVSAISELCDEIAVTSVAEQD